MSSQSRFNQFVEEYEELVKKYSAYIDSCGKYGSPAVVISRIVLSKSQIDEILNHLTKEGAKCEDWN